MNQQAQVQEQRSVRSPRTMGELLAWALAAASVASAAIHFSVIGEHFHEAWYFGTFFAVVVGRSWRGRSASSFDRADACSWPAPRSRA